ncbi:MAG: trigger factor [Acidobacteria bacterium]|nr:MAG: trigger factor [Acidobacteriota bacterium]
MKAELIDVSECKKNLEIEIPQEDVDAEINHIAQELARKARVPGFRPGKAPVGVVKTRYRDEIVSEMMQHLLPKYFGAAIETRKLDIVQAPQYEGIDYTSGQPLRFKAVFEIYPALDVTNYVGIPVEEVSSKVEDSEVEGQLKKLQEDMAELVPVEEDRSVKEGDFTEISFTGTFPESDQPPVTAEKAVCEIGGRTTLKEFTENLLGTRVNDEKTFGVSYRPDYPEKRLAGKTVEYKVKVEAIKQKELPDIDDEFAQRLGDYKTLDGLKAKIREDLGKHKAEHAQEQMREKLLEWLEDNNEFELPESLVERQLQIRVQRLVRDLARQGINPQRLDVDWGRIREDQQQQAVRDVKGSLILEHVSEKENIDVTNEEIDAEIEKIAAETKRPLEKVREVLTRDDGLDRLKTQIRNKKTLDFLQERARVQNVG